MRSAFLLATAVVALSLVAIEPTSAEAIVAGARFIATDNVPMYSPPKSQDDSIVIPGNGNFSRLRHIRLPERQTSKKKVPANNRLPELPVVPAGISIGNVPALTLTNAISLRIGD